MLIVKHSTEYLYLCSQCDTRFSTHKNMRQHMNNHTSKFKCTECGRCFPDDSKLAIHRRSHSGERPFECTVCSKRFTRSAHLVRHSRIHSGKKPYKCHVCEKAFIESSRLDTHMGVPLVDKLYKCSLCNKRFSSARSLRSHDRYVHNNSRPRRKCPYCGMHFRWSHQCKAELVFREFYKA